MSFWSPPRLFVKSWFRFDPSRGALTGLCLRACRRGTRRARARLAPTPSRRRAPNPAPTGGRSGRSASSSPAVLVAATHRHLHTLRAPLCSTHLLSRLLSAASGAPPHTHGAHLCARAHDPPAQNPLLPISRAAPIPRRAPGRPFAHPGARFSDSGARSRSVRARPSAGAETRASRECSLLLLLYLQTIHPPAGARRSPPAPLSADHLPPHWSAPRPILGSSSKDGCGKRGRGRGRIPRPRQQRRRRVAAAAAPRRRRRARADGSRRQWRSSGIRSRRSSSRRSRRSSSSTNSSQPAAAAAAARAAAERPALVDEHRQEPDRRRRRRRAVSFFFWASKETGAGARALACRRPPLRTHVFFLLSLNLFRHESRTHTRLRKTQHTQNTHNNTAPAPPSPPWSASRS